MAILQIVKADITKEKVDAVVNSANGQLQHFGGVAEVICNAAGKTFQAESTKYLHDNGMIRIGGACHTSAGG